MIELSLPMLFAIVLVVVAVLFWHDSIRVREAANRIAREACKRSSVQLLDGTVALARFRPRWDKAGPRIERTYVFDYAVNGVGRSSGFIIMVGDEMQHLGLEAH